MHRPVKQNNRLQEKGRPESLQVDHSHSLVRFVKDLLDKNYETEFIRSSLVKQGFSKEIVETTVRHAINERRQELSPLDKTIIAFTVIFLLAFISWVAVMLESSAFKVVIGFMPSILTLVSVVILIEHLKGRFHQISWIFPFLFAFLFFLVARTGEVQLLSKMETGNIAFLNLVVSLAVVAVLNLTGMMHIHKDVFTKITKLRGEARESRREHLKVAPERIREYIRSIEDKCKAFNAVVGRVYSVSHGGSAAMRKLIMVDSEWYNRFSIIDEDDFMEHANDAKLILTKIQIRLHRSRKKEIEIFADECNALRRLKRDKSGHDRIIDVLKHNDSDPVETYYNAALEFCEKALDALRKA